MGIHEDFNEEGTIYTGNPIWVGRRQDGNYFLQKGDKQIIIERGVFLSALDLVENETYDGCLRGLFWLADKRYEFVFPDEEAEGELVEVLLRINDFSD